MRFLKGFIVGGVIVGALAFAAGHNHGRGAPILSNPMGDTSLGEEVREAGEQARDATQKLLDKATGK